MKKCILFIIFSLLMIGLAAAEETNNPLWISIVRADGILVPIGIYNNAKWVNAWPETSIDEQPDVQKLVKAKNGKVLIKDIPIAWLGKSKKMPTLWYLWSRKTDPLKINIVNAQQYESHCSGGWALKTDLPPGRL